MPRSHLRLVVRDDRGRVVIGARGNVFEADGTTPVAGMWNAPTGGGAVTSLVSNAQGELEGWTDVAKTVKVTVTDNGDTAFPAGGSAPFSFADFTESIDVGAIADVSAHEAAADPHAGYRLESVQIATTDIANGAVTAAKVASDVATQAELDAAAATAAQSSSTFKDIFVLPTGDDANDGLSKGRAKRTLAAALTAMGQASRGIIHMGEGVIDAGAGTSLAGYRCFLRGMGAGTIVRPSVAQTGPTLDFETWIPPGRGAGGTDTFTENGWHGDFTVEGDNTAGTAKKGINLGHGLANACVATAFRNITARKTGGVPFDIGTAEICTFENVILMEPVSVVANDVPYLQGSGACNGNRFINVGLRSLAAGTTQNIGASGAVVLGDDGTYRPYGNVFLGCWDENLHVPENGQMVRLRGARNKIADWTTHDILSSAASPTNNCHFRLQSPAVSDFGGNEITGHIPGRGSGVNGVAFGVILEQSRNAVSGAKGWNGNNVRIAAGVSDSAVTLRGRESGVTAAGAVNESVLLNNIVDDEGFPAPRIRGARWYKPASAGAASTQALAVNMIYLVPFWFPHPVSLDGLGIEVATAGAGAGAVGRHALYRESLSLYRGAPNELALLYESDPWDALTTGAKGGAVGPFTVGPGIVWGAVVTQVGTTQPTLRAAAALPFWGIGVAAANTAVPTGTGVHPVHTGGTTAGAFPATIAAGSLGTAFVNCPMLQAHIA